MSIFKNVFYDSWKNKMLLWELNDNGETELKTFDHEIEYYVQDPTKKSSIKDIYGNPVIRQVTTNKDKLKDLKESGTKMYMSDFDEKVKFLHKRYGDQEDKIDFDKYIIANIDIEIQTEGTFPKPEEALFPINLITVQFMRSGEMFTFGLKPYTGDKIKNYFHCSSEAKLIENFCKLLKYKKTDIITGWNVATNGGFDVPYIVNRIDRLNLECSLSPVNKTIRKHNGDIELVGISVVDMMEAYKKFTYQNHPSFSLNAIAMYELGEKKNDLEGQIQDSNSIDWNSFVEYNQQDVLLVYGIEEKKRLLELIITLCTQTRTPFENAFSTIAVVEGYMLRNLLKEYVVIQDRKEIFTNETILGGYVDAIPGIYNRLISIDGESLYPTAIRQFNISPETKRLEYEEGMIKTTIPGIFYIREEGILPKIVTKIFKERKELKNIASEAEIVGDMEKFQYYDSQQLVKKILINCFHPDTDIMTCGGIKNIKDLKVGDEVFSINKETNKLERKKITFTINKPYDDKLIKFESRRCKLLVTKDHDMLRVVNKNKYTETITAENLMDYGYVYMPQHLKEERIVDEYIFLNEWIDNIHDYYFIIKTDEDTRTINERLENVYLSHLNVTVMGVTGKKKFRYIDNILTTNEINILENNGYKVYVRHKRDIRTNHQRLRMTNTDFSKFIGWYLSEGSLYKNTYKEYENSTRGMSKKISISQYKSVNPTYYKEIDELLTDICDTHSTMKKCFSFCSDLMYDLIEKNFGSKFEKRIFKTELGEKLNFDILHEAMYKGDGNKAEYRYTITEKDKPFFNDFMILTLRLGFIPRYRNDSTCYRINRRHTTYFTKNEHFSEVEYQGDVYCVSVEDNHTLLAGDSNHGSFFWTGNCMYGVLCNKYFHFYDLDNASVVTSTGREIIQYVAKTVDDYLTNYFPKIATKYYPNFCSKITKKPKVVIIDTDSNYINLEEIYLSCNSGQDFLTFALEFEKLILNPFLKNILDIFAEKYNAKNIMNFKREKIISKLFVQCKKKYICKILANEKKIYKEPTIKITGIEINKSDLCKFSKDSLMELCNIMLDGEKPNKQQMLNHIRKSFEDFKKQSITEISTPKGVKNYDKYFVKLDSSLSNFISGTPIHNRASIVYNYIIKDRKLPYMEIMNGTKLKYIYVKPKNKYKTDVVGYIGNWPKEFNEIFEIDYEKQFEKQYLNISERFFETLLFGPVTLKDSKLLSLIEED